MAPANLRQLPTLDNLKGFVAAARHLSFTKAALELSLSQSAVSRQVQGLEEQLGTALFLRTTRQLRLTPAGELLYRNASDMLARLAAVVDDITSARQRPRVTVSASIGFSALWLVPRLSDFQGLHPDIGVRLSADNRRVDLEAEDVDVAIRYCTAVNAPAGSLKLFDEVLLPVASPALAASLPAGPALNGANLPSLTLLALEDGSDYPGLRWENWLDPLGLSATQAKGLLQFNHYDQCIAAALAGHGAALGRLPLIRDRLGEGRLVPLAPPRDSADGHGYYLLRAPGGQRPEVARFVAWLQAVATRESSADAIIPDHA